jgi:hypothetical protein
MPPRGNDMLTLLLMTWAHLQWPNKIVVHDKRARGTRRRSGTYAEVADVHWRRIKR